MADRYTFTLPADALVVSAMLKISRHIQNKDYIAAFDFEGLLHPVSAIEDVPSGLHWSTKLETAFAYLPEASIGKADNFTVCELPTFAIPHGARKVEISVRSWSASVAQMPSPVSSIILESELLGKPLLIVSEEEIQQ